MVPIHFCALHTQINIYRAKIRAQAIVKMANSGAAQQNIRATKLRRNRKKKTITRANQPNNRQSCDKTGVKCALTWKYAFNCHIKKSWIKCHHHSNAINEPIFFVELSVFNSQFDGFISLIFTLFSSLSICVWNIFIISNKLVNWAGQPETCWHFETFVHHRCSRISVKLIDFLLMSHNRHRHSQKTNWIWCDSRNFIFGKFSFRVTLLMIATILFVWIVKYRVFNYSEHNLDSIYRLHRFYHRHKHCFSMEKDSWISNVMLRWKR